MIRFLLLFFILFFNPLFSYGQKKLKDVYKVSWYKSFGISDDYKIGLNFNLPFHFNSEIPVLNKKYSSSEYTFVFYVLKSSKKSEKLFSMFNNGQLHAFYTDKINSEVERPIDFELISKGGIINYSFYNKGFKRGSKNGILYLENEYNKSLSELYELLICSNCNNQDIKNKIETYLAIKYGVTLEDKNKYLSSNDIKVWDVNYNKIYNNRIFGIARDDFFDLEKVASHSNTDTIFIAKKSNHEQRILNNTYVLIGDNDGVKVFDKKTGIFKRKWLIQNNGDHDESIDLNFNIEPQKEIQYFLNSSEGLIFENDLNDTLKISFKGIDINKGNYIYLTLKQKKAFDFKIFENEEGINKRSFLTFNEIGIPPFYITAIDLTTSKEYFMISEDFDFELTGLPSSTYSFIVKDLEGQEVQKKNVYLHDTSRDMHVSLASSWILNTNKPLEIRPMINGGISRLDYHWYFQDKLISKKPVLFVNYAGNFRLELFDEKGNKEFFSFTVKEKEDEKIDSDSMWGVSPNPVNMGEEFTVTYVFDTPKNVDFYIYTLEGKLILRKKLGIIGGGTFNYILEGKTTYLIIPIINSKITMKKLIVK